MPSVDTIFCAAIDIESPEQRDAYLRTACDGDDAIRQKVDRLLAAHFDGTGPLDAPPPGLPDFTLPPGTQVGRYTLGEVLGEGGMGVVYKAEQAPPVRRTVALKLIKLGMDTREVVRRFQAERQALALMDHPNLARVLDAGATDAGRPYFVMEYVAGEPITAFCDRERLGIPDRLALFVQACDAVHHAHQKAILHRDLKPGNILVAAAADAGAPPVVKVIDFGIAKALGGNLAERTLFTARGQLVGTPQYMSPEQADLGEPDVDTRSDIYSLGVVLYELLSGAPPMGAGTFRGITLAEMQRIIRQDEPPRPSERIQRLSPAEASDVAARRRAGDAGALRQLLRTELEWVVLKAMAKDRAERYRSAAELADDVRNYLDHRPLIAGPRTRRYRLRKFLAKHAQAVTAAAAVVAVVLGLVIALAIVTRQAVNARRTAESERQRAEAESGRTAAQRDRAVAAELAANAERRKAEVLLAQALVDQAAALDAAGGASGAWAEFARAAEAFERAGLPTRAADVGLLRSYDAHPPPLMVMDGHTHDVLSADLSRDGTHALSGGKDGTVRYWDVRTGACLRTFDPRSGWVIGVALSPDGRLALSGGDDHAVRVWDVDAGTQLHLLKGHGGPVRVVAFSPNGRRALSGSDEGIVIVWDVHAGKPLHTLTGLTGGVRAVAVHPDGRSALVGSDGRLEPSLTLWDLETGEKLRTLDERPEHRSYNTGVRGIAFLPGNRQAVTSGYDRAVKLWDLADEARPPTQLVGGTTTLVAVAPSPDGKSILVGSDDGTVKLYELASGRELREFHGGTRGVRAVAFSGDGRLVFAAGLDRQLRTWIADGDHPREAHAMNVTERYSDVWFAWDGLVCVTEVRNEHVVVYDSATGQPLVKLSSRDPRVLEFLCKGEPARATRVDDADAVRLSLWGNGGNGGAGATSVSIPWDGRRDSAVRLSPDGALALFPRDDGFMGLWDARKGELLWVLPEHSGPVRGEFSPDGTRAVTCAADYIAYVWDLASRRRLCRIPLGGGAELAFSPDGRRLLTGDSAGVVQLWDAGDGRELRRFVGHGSSVVAVQFRDAGRTAATASADGILKLWDVEQGLAVGNFGGPGRLLAWDLSDDGRMLATARQVAARRADLLVWDLGRPAVRRSFDARLRAAQRRLGEDPEDAESLQVIGEWLAFRGMDELATPVLERARRDDGQTAALPLARCYWKLGRREDAAREFARAARQNEAPAHYLRLCLEALERPPQ